MKTSGPLAWRSRAALGRLAADDPAHCRIVTKTFGIVHILVASETAEHRLPQQADRRMATVLAGPHIGEHVARRRGQSKCVVKFAIAQLITNKPVTLTGYLRFPVATGLFRPRRRAREAVVVHPGSSRDGAGARVGLGCVVLHRSGGSSSSERHPETQGRFRCICPTITCDMRLSGFSLAGLLLIAFAVSLRGRMPAPS